MQFRRENVGGGKCGDPGMYNHGKNGWHDDNRRGVDIPCGNQAHYRGTGRVYGLVNQIGGGGWHPAIIILRIHPPFLPPFTRNFPEKLRI